MMNHTPLSPARRLVLAGLMLALSPGAALPDRAAAPDRKYASAPCTCRCYCAVFCWAGPWAGRGVTAPAAALGPVWDAAAVPGGSGHVSGAGMLRPGDRPALPRVRHTPAGDFAVLAAAMVSGRLVWVPPAL